MKIQIFTNERTIDDFYRIGGGGEEEDLIFNSTILRVDDFVESKSEFPPIGNSLLFITLTINLPWLSKQQISGQMESGTHQRNFYKPIGR